MFKSHHGQVVVSVVGAILTVTVVSSVCRRSFRLGRRNRKQRQHNSQLQCAVQHGRCTDVQTFQWLTSSADIAAAYAPQMTSIQLVNTPENASIGCLHPLVCTFMELRQLSLVGTRLVHIPYSLPALQKLEELQLSRNTIVCVPGEIGAMTSLRSLDLSHNQIQTLPSSLCKLTNLTALNLMGNKLSKLPDDIGNLHNLRILGLKSNMLVTLPQSFTRLSSLVELFITDNQLTSLPEGFGALTSLVKLQASFNCFSHLPIDLLHAPNLELMRVAVCHLSQLPDQLMHLPTHLIHDEEVSGDTGSLVRSNGNQEEGHLDSAEDPVVFPKLAWFSLGGNPACAPLPKPRPGLLHFSASDLTMGEKLGDGASGEVSRASLHKGDAESGQQAVAVKTFRSDISPDGRTQEEVAIACALDHPNLTRVIGIVPGPAQIPPAEQPLLVMDIISGQPMAAKPTSKHLLRCRWAEGERFEASLLLQIAKDLAAALGYLHSLHICHGDVYAHNVLLDRQQGKATLCDFGAAFAYRSEDWFWERMEVRAYGLLLHDMVERMQSPPSQCALGVQRLQQLVQACMEAPPWLRLNFKSIGFELEELRQSLLC
ncbi:hypothetical protein DUNSADRAFT_16484 [Dunaliella salina]|uniref:Protein kinase domain-containing protein n=1 Tax=Dunaliella salina TaxID=3046 RepID=A0ABQ7G3N3_DUNSA|nr:hypothetical protein DUNSADRAFT_16484 [Dunaliella salina]|eukprot:KAF5829159.1 hypothetical protein DUNSADRAFT_16484 [Dunaliella salina]